MDASIRRLEDDMKKNKEKLITAASNFIGNIKTNRTTLIGNRNEKKTTVWLFQATNWRNFTREDLNMAMKGESQDEN